MNVLREIGMGFLEIAYPKVCTVCTNPLSEAESNICWICLHNRFEKCSTGYNVQEEILLPEGVHDIFSLWYFDKGGLLQKIIHHLKYSGLSDIAHDVGRVMGTELMNWMDLDGKDFILIPVPLHPSKQRKRGYNQAEELAKGIAEVTKWELIQLGAIKRIKRTKTQTGFDISKRRRNMNQAFEVVKAEQVRGKICIIVDDIFTTGATTFELSKMLRKENPESIIIASIARA